MDEWRGTRSEQRMYDRVLRDARAAGFDLARLYLLSGDRRSVVGKAQLGTEDGFVGTSWPLSGDSRQKSLLKTRRHTLIERKGKGEPPHVSKGPSVWGWVPLVVGRKVIGGLAVASRGRRLDKDALASLVPVAARAAGEIERGLSLWQVERRAQALDAVLRISARINSSLDLRRILIDTCQAAKEMIGVDHCGFVLFDPDLKTGKVYAEFPSIQTVGGVVPLVTPLAKD